MSLVQQLQTKLKTGNWIFDDVSPSFQRQLEKKVNSQKLNKNISELCLAHYKKLSLSETMVNSSTRGLSDINISAQTLNAIENILSTEYPGSHVKQFENMVSEKLNRSLHFIETLNPLVYPLIDRTITLFLRVSGVSFRSASHPLLFGIILIGDGVEGLSSEQAAVSIIHELAHQELFLINLVDRLVNRPFDHNEIHAPFQGKKRPPIGRLHSLWALYRMVEFQMLQKNINQKHLDLLTKNLEAFEDGELTEMGQILVQVAKERAS
ncbi:MAG: HEXXH motif-containing putative peptide modification protein [Pseudobdellovibrionaceae bacterium]